MEKVVPIDAKGRVTIPRELREGLGGSVVVRKTRDGLMLLPGEKKDFISEFMALILSQPRRTGKPRNPSPAKMKAIWKQRY